VPLPEERVVFVFDELLVEIANSASVAGSSERRVAPRRVPGVTAEQLGGQRRSSKKTLFIEGGPAFGTSAPSLAYPPRDPHADFTVGCGFLFLWTPRNAAAMLAINSRSQPSIGALALWVRVPVDIGVLPRISTVTQPACLPIPSAPGDNGWPSLQGDSCASMHALSPQRDSGWISCCSTW